MHPILVLSGGNALGAYQAGAIDALLGAGIEPAWVAGGSIGAINGAILCGNAPGDRVARLRDFWGPADAPPAWPGFETARRTAAVAATLAGGRPGLFAPRAPWEPHPGLYDTDPLAATLARLVDFERLNAGSPRFTATAIDVESGEDVAFDTARGSVTPERLRASGALIPVFPPVEVDGRLLGDAGISLNLPLDAVLAEAAGETTIVAIDLLPLAAPRPATLGDTIARIQDLTFAVQSRRAIAAWGSLLAARGDAAPAVTLLHLSYAAQGDEVSGKAFDFSAPSVAQRWRTGAADMTRALAALADRRVQPRPGLTLLRPGADGLEEQRPALG